MDGPVRPGRAASAQPWTGNGSTVVKLESVWDAVTGLGDPPVVIAPWNSAIVSCGISVRVWCVQD